MYSYYLQKGHSLQGLLGLSFAEKMFYTQSMIVELEQKAEIMGALGGGGAG